MCVRWSRSFWGGVGEYGVYKKTENPPSGIILKRKIKSSVNRIYSRQITDTLPSKFVCESLKDSGHYW